MNIVKHKEKWKSFKEALTLEIINIKVIYSNLCYQNLKSYLMRLFNCRRLFQELLSYLINSFTVRNPSHRGRPQAIYRHDNKKSGVLMKCVAKTLNIVSFQSFHSSSQHKRLEFHKNGVRKNCSTLKDLKSPSQHMFIFSGWITVFMAGL